MPNLSDLTIDQLRAATKAQLVTAITNKLNAMTKRRIIEFLMDKLDFHDEPQVAYRPDGQIASKAEVRRDANGTKAGECRIAWAYYPTGEVDIITVQELDASDAEVSYKTIKHYIDGRQPVMTEK